MNFFRQFSPKGGCLIQGHGLWTFNFPWMIATFAVATLGYSLLCLAGANPIGLALIYVKSWAVMWFFPDAMALIHWLRK